MEIGRHLRVKWDGGSGGGGGGRRTFDSGDFCKEVLFTVTVSPLLFVHLMDTHINFLFQVKLFRQLQLWLEG